MTYNLLSKEVRGRCGLLYREVTTNSNTTT